MGGPDGFKRADLQARGKEARPADQRQSADQTIETSCGGSAWYSYFTAPFVIVYSASIEDFALMPSQLRLYSRRLRVVTERQAFPIGAQVPDRSRDHTVVATLHTTNGNVQ